MVMAYNTNAGAGLASGVEKLANAFLQKRRNEGLASGLSQIQGGDWEGGINTIADTDPNTALGLVQYKQRQDDAMNLAQMKIAADMQNRNTLTPYQQIMIGLKQQELANKQTNTLNPFDKKRIENIAKDMDENVAASQARIEDYARMEQLLNDPEVATGGWKGAINEELPDWALNEKTAELRSIIKKIVPQMRPTGSGTTSDRDMKVFEQATVGLGKNKQANLNIARGRRLVDENNIAKEQLRYEWVNNGGNLGDFDTAWRQYLNANPIFASNDGKLNQNRQDAFSWFSGGGMTQPQPQGNSQSVSEGTIIEDANENRLVLRGGQWQQM